MPDTNSDTHKVIVFKNTFLTFKAERALKKAAIEHKVVTKPRHISSDCGLAIQIPANSEQAVSSLMLDKDIEFLGIW
jgi:hypothetical protein